MFLSRALLAFIELFPNPKREKGVVRSGLGMVSLKVCCALRVVAVKSSLNQAILFRFVHLGDTDCWRCGCRAGDNTQGASFYQLGKVQGKEWPGTLVFGFFLDPHHFSIPKGCQRLTELVTIERIKLF